MSPTALSNSTAHLGGTSFRTLPPFRTPLQPSLDIDCIDWNILGGRFGMICRHLACHTFPLPYRWLWICAGVPTQACCSLIVRSQLLPVLVKRIQSMSTLPRDVRGWLIDPPFHFVVSSESTSGYHSTVEWRRGHYTSAKNPDTSFHRCPNNGLNIVPYKARLVQELR